MKSGRNYTEIEEKKIIECLQILYDIEDRTNYENKQITRCIDILQNEIKKD